MAGEGHGEGGGVMAMAKNGGNVAKATAAIKDLPLTKIRPDGGTQTRAGLNQETIDEYAVAMLAGAEFPPVVVFRDAKGEHWIADGFHRYYAAKAKGVERKTLKAEIRDGSQRDALLYALGANRSHGLRRTNADKRKAIDAFLHDSEWVAWTDSRIAEHAGIACSAVADRRADLETRGVILHVTERIGSDGKTYDVTKQQASNAKRKKPKPPAKEPIRVTRDRSADAPDDEPTYPVDDPSADEERETFLRDKSATEAPDEPDMAAAVDAYERDTGCAPCDSGEDVDHEPAAAPQRLMFRAPCPHCRRCPNGGPGHDIDASVAEAQLAAEAREDAA